MDNVISALVVALFLVLGITMVLWPQGYLKLLANRAKWYKERFELSDEELDETAWSFTRQRFFGGSASRFAEEAGNRPEKYRAATNHIRIWGLVMLLLLGGTVLLGMVFGQSGP